jgi:hypothetical protein
MSDPTGEIRMAMIAAGIPEQDLAEAKETWTTEQLREQFEVKGFMAPYVVVRRKSDGIKGSLEFTGQPRYYFNWSEE